MPSCPSPPPPSPAARAALDAALHDLTFAVLAKLRRLLRVKDGRVQLRAAEAVFRLECARLRAGGSVWLDDLPGDEPNVSCVGHASNVPVFNSRHVGSVPHPKSTPPRPALRDPPPPPTLPSAVPRPCPAAAPSGGTHAAPHLMTAHLNLIITLSESGKPDAALDAARQAVARFPDAAKAHGLLGGKLLTRKDYPAAVAAYRRAVELDPTDAKYHINLGGAHSGLKDYPAAAASTRRAIELDPANALAYLNLSRHLTYLDDFDGVLAAARKATALDPKRADGWHKAGLSLGGKRDWAATLPYYRKAVELDPKKAAHHATLGYALLKAGDPDAGIARLLAAAALDPQDPPARHFLVLAVTDAAAPDNPTLAVALGRILQARGDDRGAADAFRRATDREPTSAAAWHDLGDSLLRLKDPVAVLALRRSIKSTRSGPSRTAGWAQPWSNRETARGRWPPSGRRSS